MLKLDKNNFFEYFKFYYHYLGNQLFVNIILCIGISFLDGIGLAMFMPLLEALDNSSAHAGSESVGALHFITDGIQALGFALTIDTVLSILVIMFVLKGMIKFIQLNSLVRIKHGFLKKIRNDLVDHLQDLSYQGFLKLDVGRIQNTMTTEAGKLYAGMNAYFSAIQTGVMLVVYIVLAFLANYQFAILVALGAFLSNYIYRKIYTSTKRIALQLSVKGNSFNSYLVQAIFNFKYLKSTNYFEKFSVKLKNVISEAELLTRKTGFYNAITASTREPLVIIIVVLVIEFQLKVAHSQLSTILLSLLLFYRALTFLMVIQTYWQSFVQNLGAITSVNTLLDEMRDMQENSGAVPFKGLRNAVELSNVSFSFGERKVLDNITLKIPKNQTVALVGESGSGKTTLANMLSGLIQPQSGNLIIDGVSISELDKKSYRNKIGYISQEPVVFNDSIFNNITFWSEANPENKKRFWEVIELASLTDFIKSLPEGDKTKLGDNGILISGGQKQRISIARELYKSVELLILDEATSALDSETEKFIQQNIDKLHGSFTIVIIAHRLSTIKSADKIFLMEQGSVNCSGDFQEMLETSPKFKRMVALQEFN